MDTPRHRVVLDTNVFVSAIVFGGTPRKILQLALLHRIGVVISPNLLVELSRILSQKFLFSSEETLFIERQFRKRFMVVAPRRRLHVLKDEPDNRVLEAAVTGHAGTIVTGDTHLLNLLFYRGVTIVTPRQFLDNISE